VHFGKFCNGLQIRKLEHVRSHAATCQFTPPLAILLKVLNIRASSFF
jgi:hypothetical protein